VSDVALGGKVQINQGYGWSMEGQIVVKPFRNVKNLTFNLTQGFYFCTA
jgi:hypothetical protein